MLHRLKICFYLMLNICDQNVAQIENMPLPYVKMFMTKLLHRLNVYNYGSYVKMFMTKLLHKLNV
jgi:hypothetical protein